MAGAGAEDCFHLFAEGVFLVQRNVGLYRAGKAAAVNSYRAASSKRLFSKRYAVRVASAFQVGLRHNVLKELFGGGSGLAHKAQVFIEISVLKSFCKLSGSLVFRKEMPCASDGKLAE